MRQAVREIDALIILAAMPDLFETVAFPKRVREQMVSAMWKGPHKKHPVVRHGRADPEAVQPVRTAAATPTRAAPRRHTHNQPPPQRPADIEALSERRQLVSPMRRRLREVLPVSTLRRVTLVAAISQWRLVVAQRSRQVRLLARALGACRARMFCAWRRVVLALRRARRPIDVAAADEAAAVESALTVERVARAGSWPRLLGEAQYARRKVRDLRRWQNLEACAVMRGWSVLAHRGRVLRQWSWVLKHSLVLQRCLEAWEQVVLGGAVDGHQSGLVSAASAAPFVQRLVRPPR